MSIDFQIDIKAKYVQVSCQGIINNKALLNVYEEASGIAESQGLRAVLVDIRDLEGAPLTTMERYEHGVTVARVQLNHENRIIIAVVGQEPMIDTQRFGETVATNRGAVAKVFSDIDDAVTWLEREAVK